MGPPRTHLLAGWRNADSKRAHDTAIVNTCPIYGCQAPPNRNLTTTGGHFKFGRGQSQLVGSAALSIHVGRLVHSWLKEDGTILPFRFQRSLRDIRTLRHLLHRGATFFEGGSTAGSIRVESTYRSIYWSTCLGTRLDPQVLFQQRNCL